MQRGLPPVLIAGLAVVGLGGYAGAQQAPGLRVGVAQAAITPTLSAERTVWIAGYQGNRPAKMVHDDLWVRALALQDGERGVVLAVCDLLGFNRPLLLRVRQGLAAAEALKRAGIKPEEVHVAATHTHSGPDTIGLWGPSEGTSGVDAQYIEFLITTVARCVEEAVAAMAPARLKVATGSAPGLSRNDRFRDILEACGIRDYASRDIPAEAEILDPDFAVMQVLGAAGSVMATVVNWACHPEMSHTNLITSDFPHWLRGRLQEEYGGMALYFQGAEGGMVTGNSLPGEDIVASERIGLALAERVIEALSKGEEVQASPIKAQSRSIKVSIENEGFKAAMAAGILPITPGAQGELETEVTHLTVGPIEFVTIPGEALPNIALMLKRSMRGEPKFVLGICDDELGYILAPEDWGLPLYRYETSMSVASTIGRVIGDALLEMTEEAPPLGVGGGDVAAQVQAFFASLAERFKPEQAEGVEALYQINLTGEGGGQWYVTVHNKQCAVATGMAEKPSLSLQAEASDWLKIVNGELNPTVAVLQGKLTFQPFDIAAATKFAELFF